VTTVPDPSAVQGTVAATAGTLHTALPIGVGMQHSILPIMSDAEGTDLPNSTVVVLAPASSYSSASLGSCSPCSARCCPPAGPPVPE
jgi:hypothetical protein